MNKQFKLESLVRENIRNLSPYSTARDEARGEVNVFLDANESPYANGGYNRYPDPHQKELKKRIGVIKGINPENIFLGNGSDEAIDLIYRVFCTPGKDNVVSISPTYGMYSVCGHINDVEVREVPLDEDFNLPVEALLKACDRKTKVIFLCSPNNPTGNAFPTEDILRIVESFKGIVVLDEAYADFSSKGSLRKYIYEYDNLIILQTFSKAYGLAALRLGMAFAQKDIIAYFSKVKYPYNINKSTQDLVSAAILKPITVNTAHTISQRGTMARFLSRLGIVEKIYPSEANFLLVKFYDADKVYDYLISKGIIVRNRSHVPGCRNCLRITVGTQKENIKTLEYLMEYDKSDIR